jgi:predicted DNA binding CopG/RHH family protein
MSKTTDFDYELDDYEKEIEEGLKMEDFKTISNYEREKKKYLAAAKATLAKTKNINIRISPGDLFNIKNKASKQGIPYQTLISSLIHQYSTDRIDYNVLKEPQKTYKK